jgi:hypothetical protein
MSFCTECGKPLRVGSLVCEYCRPAIQTSASVPFTAAASARIAVSKTLFVVAENFGNDLDAALRKHLAKPLEILEVNDVESIHDKANQAVRRLLARGELKFVCLIGDWDQVPPYKVRNPSKPCSGQDPFCWTDSLYGGADTYSEADILTAIPKIPVGRIPSTDISVVMPALLEEPLRVDPSQAFAFAVTAQCWSIATQTIVKGFTDSQIKAPLIEEPSGSGFPVQGVLASPGWEEGDLRRCVSVTGLNPGAVLLFNVHGSADEPCWVGEGDWGGYTNIMQTDTIQNFNKAILFSEACYGGALGYDEPSMVESFFSRGGKAFVGCSVIAWGASGGELCGADLMALHFFNALREGKAFGESLSHAKNATLDAMSVHDEIAQKSILSFNLFGAPWHELKRAQLASTLPTVGAQESMLERIRRRRPGGVASDESALDAVRNRYRQRLSSEAQYFFLQRDEALNRLNTFKDREKIKSVLDSIHVDFYECDFEEIQVDSEFFFRISGHSKKFPTSKELFILSINGQGELTHQLTTKGWP